MTKYEQGWKKFLLLDEQATKLSLSKECLHKRPRWYSTVYSLHAVGVRKLVVTQPEFISLF